MKPLAGYRVLDCGQFLSTPYAGQRLADLGAHVIKLEKTGEGDICRTLYTSNVSIEGNSTLFHAINRNKDGISIDLKSDHGKKQLKQILVDIDIVLVNFRPDVSKKLSLDFETIKGIKPNIVYGEITGYGTEGEWKKKPGQDLLVQSLSGITYLNGKGNQPPTPFGISLADLLAGEHLVQGVLAGLYRSAMTDQPILIQVDLLSSIMDVQFESFTTFLNDGNQKPKRGNINNANPYLGAPYGIYQTLDGFIAISMTPLEILGEALSIETLVPKDVNTSEVDDSIRQTIQNKLLTGTSKVWLNILEKHHIWSSDVYDWQQLLDSNGFQHLNLLQSVTTEKGYDMTTTRCPITIDKEIFTSTKAAPNLGQDNKKYLQ